MPIPPYKYRDAEAMVAGVKSLPSGPQILSKIQKLSDDPNSSIYDLTSAINLDASIIARVLRFSNSPMCNIPGNRCYTIEDAVQRIGFERINQVVAIAVALELTATPLEAYGITPNEQWKRSVACAMSAEALAMRIGMHPTMAYTIGLLHNVGMYVIQGHLSKSTFKMRYDPFPGEYSASEIELLGFTNFDITASLMKRWIFPSEMIEVISTQTTCFNNPVEANKMALVVFLARWMRNAICHPSQDLIAPNEACMDVLGVSESLLLTLVKDLLKSADAEQIAAI